MSASHSSHKPGMLSSMFTMKCPSCRKTSVFVNKSMFPLDKCLAMKAECDECGERLVAERNNGGGINYALSMLLFFLNLLWYWPIFGLSYMDDSAFWFLGTSTAIVVFAQPFLMRLSRMIYLYLYIGFGHSRRVIVEDNASA